MKKDKKDFRIDISCKHTTVSIIPDDIPNLLKKDFTIFSDINDVEYIFQIYYLSRAVPIYLRNKHILVLILLQLFQIIFL